MNELIRLAFVEERYGVGEAVAFAVRTARIYRTSLLRSRKRGYPNPHHASLPGYRKGCIESYVILKQYAARHA